MGGWGGWLSEQTEEEYSVVITEIFVPFHSNHRKTLKKKNSPEVCVKDEQLGEIESFRKRRVERQLSLSQSSSN